MAKYEAGRKLKKKSKGREADTLARLAKFTEKLGGGLGGGAAASGGAAAAKDDAGSDHDDDASGWLVGACSEMEISLLTSSRFLFAG